MEKENNDMTNKISEIHKSVGIRDSDNGYKQTEVGVIPSDWKVVSLGDVFSFSGGFSASRDQLSNDGFCYLHYGDIHKSNKTFIDVKREYSDIPKLNIPIRAISRKSLLDDGDVVFVDASEDDEGASRHIVIQNPDCLSYISGLNTIVSKSKDETIDKKFRQYCFQTLSVKRQFLYFAVGTKVTGISKTNIARIQIPLPPTLAEQERIATALSDVDRLIASLEKLIAKKRNIKQGAMQELLTGKKRLPGYGNINGKPVGYKKTEVGVIPEDWESKQLGELFEITSSKRVFQSEWKMEGIPFYRARELAVLGDRDTINNALFISKEMYVEYRNKYGVPLVGDMLVTGVGTLGKTFVVRDGREFYFKDGNIIWFKLSGIVNPNFLEQLYLTKVITKQIEDGSAGTTVGTYTISGARKTTIPFPSLTEQIAIAQILSDMDAEIEQLEQKLSKCKFIKQGMMQELLTGKIRLA